MFGGLALIVVLFAGLTSVDCSGKWSYTGKNGPRYWHDIFPKACSGKSQSPIDIKPEETMYHPGLKDFAIWYDPPMPGSKMYLKNTGYTVQVDIEGEFFVTNAGLGHIYKAVQFHFHWGHKSHHGSEHLIDGQASPIELHIVTFNQDLFSDIGEAVQQKGGLAVLGVMFKLSEEDNPSFDEIIRGMKYIRNPEKLTKIEINPMSLRDLLPDDIRRYYRYNGSLTTPGCFETVTWSVFDQMQTISHRQMAEFRKMLQFKREHHHKDPNIHAQQSDQPPEDRQKRELTASDKEKEHNAKQVLDELGMSGKDSGFERKVLKEQLVKAKAEADMTNVVEGGDKKPKPKFIQENIVNNFRPVQHINDRIVYRSFKLREVVYVNQYDTEVVKTAGSYGSSRDRDNTNNDDGNGSAVPHLSISLLIISLSTKIFH